jgi:hypothetical protein
MLTGGCQIPAKTHCCERFSNRSPAFMAAGGGYNARMTPASQIGKWIVLAGLMVAALGAIVWALGRAGITRLPGDIQLHGRNWSLYIPLGLCILLSVVGTLVLWVINWLRQ